MEYQKSPEEERAFDEGVQARRQGQRLHHCPYDIETDAETEKCVAWRDGWRKTDIAMTEAAPVRRP